MAVEPTSRSRPAPHGGSPLAQQTRRPLKPHGVPSDPSRRRAVPPTLFQALKRRILGAPLQTAELEHERLGKPTALAVFASDNLSSVAYATEEILHVLVPLVGVVAFSLVLPLTWAMLGVLALLILSYRQTIKAYPSAGGAYIVTKDNLGYVPALVAGVSLLTDYILTVSVSISAGVAAVYSVFPAVEAYKVPLAVGLIGLIALLNLRGVKESGRLFAVPVYGFIAMMAALLGYGVYRVLVQGLSRPLPVELPNELGASGQGWLYGVGLFLVLRAFASGGAAVTGVEAISNGVPAFRVPEWRNARQTLVIMGATLGTMFLGLSYLVTKLHVLPPGEESGTVETVISQVGRVVFGDGNPLYFLLQAMTALILILAGNTSFADFPRLASFQAEDDFMPRPFTRRGSRLVFSTGIVTLAATSALLVVLFDATVTRLIPLYALGVFTSFTMSQVGMAVHHLRLRERGWRGGLAINTAGAVATAVVTLVVGVTKFSQGAWAIMVAVPLGVFFLLKLNRTYEAERGDLQVGITELNQPAHARHEIVLLVERLDAAMAHALRYARQIRPFGQHGQIVALHAETDTTAADELQEAWEANDVPIQLIRVECTDRNIPASVVEWIDRHRRDDTEMTVLIPQRGYTKWWHRLVHDRTSHDISRALRRYKDVNALLVPYFLENRGIRIKAKSNGPGAHPPEQAAPRVKP